MMISLFQITYFISRVIAFVRGLFSRIFETMRGLFFQGESENVTIPEPEIIPEIIEPATDTGGVITPFAIAISVIVVIVAIFATIQYQQYRYEREQKEGALEGHFSHVEGRGNVQKMAENESEKEGADDEREEEREI